MANKIVLRIVLLVLKNLLFFKREKAISLPLQAVLGPVLTYRFYKHFCVETGRNVAFADPVLRCPVRISPAVMPKLAMRADLSFNFTFCDLFGETAAECLERLRSEVGSTSSED